MPGITGWYADLRVRPIGVGSSGAFGSPKLNLRIFPVGIASAERVNQTQTLFLTGIPTAQAFGTTAVGQVLAPTSITTLEASGTAKLNLILYAAGIATAFASGTAQLNRYLLPTGIATAFASGTAKLNPQVYPSSVASLEAFGTAQLNRNLTAVGIASEEAFGNPIVGISGASLRTQPIASAEAFGTAAILNTTQLFPSGITSLEAFGTAKLNRYLLPVAIASLEAFGTAILHNTVVLQAFTSATDVTSDNSPGNISVSHTAAGVNRYAIVAVFWNSNQGNAATRTCTYDGVTMTSLGFVRPNSTSNALANNAFELFGLANPNTGSKTVAASVTASLASFDLAMHVFTFTGVASIDTAVVNFGTEAGTALSQTITSAVGDMVVAGFVHATVAGACISSFSITERGDFNFSASTNVGVVGEVAGAASSVTVTAARVTGQDYGEIGVNLVHV